ncbi:hypothetical protein DL96DRAFT_1735316 [Flagelloscypha sp. PMI_526]|nr:hypothetical protein DL96DRAFT_1735316 [Flagelloscypha sp. PMI_526]
MSSVVPIDLPIWSSPQVYPCTLFPLPLRLPTGRQHCPLQDIFLDLLQGLSTPLLAIFLTPSITFPLGLYPGQLSFLLVFLLEHCPISFRRLPRESITSFDTPTRCPPFSLNCLPPSFGCLPTHCGLPWLVRMCRSVGSYRRALWFLSITTVLFALFYPSLPTSSGLVRGWTTVRLTADPFCVLLLTAMFAAGNGEESLALDGSVALPSLPSLLVLTSMTGFDWHNEVVFKFIALCFIPSYHMPPKRDCPDSDSTSAPAQKKTRLEDSTLRPRKQPRGPIPSKEKPTRKQHPDRISRDQQKKEETTIKAALEIHYNVITGRLNAMEPPPLPTEWDLNAFSAILPEDDPVAHLDDPPSVDVDDGVDSQTLTDEIRTLKCRASSKKLGKYASAYRAIPEDWLYYFLATIHRSGFKNLCFDFLGGNMSSPFNELMEQILIKTFMRACTGRAYDFLCINRTIKLTYERVQRLWRNYFVRLQEEATKEAREEGSLRKTKELCNYYRQREKKGQRRADFLHRHGAPERVWKVFTESFANSDEEDILIENSSSGKGKLSGKGKSPEKDVEYKRVRNPKLGRSETWTRLVRAADEERWKEMEKEGQGHVIARERLVINNPSDTHSKIGARLPINVPVDFFQPEWFNVQPAEWRVHYKASSIGLPLKLGGGRLEDWKPWLPLLDKPFMRRHGKQVRQNYNFPTAKEALVRPRGTEYHRPEPPTFDWKSLLGDEYDGDDDGGDDANDDQGNNGGGDNGDEDDDDFYD